MVVKPSVCKRVVRCDLAIIGSVIGISTVENHQCALAPAPDKRTRPPTGTIRHLLIRLTGKESKG